MSEGSIPEGASINVPKSIFELKDSGQTLAQQDQSLPAQHTSEKATQSAPKSLTEMKRAGLSLAQQNAPEVKADGWGVHSNTVPPEPESMKDQPGMQWNTSTNEAPEGGYDPNEGRVDDIAIQRARDTVSIAAGQPTKETFPPAPPMKNSYDNHVGAPWQESGNRAPAEPYNNNKGRADVYGQREAEDRRTIENSTKDSPWKEEPIQTRQSMVPEPAASTLTPPIVEPTPISPVAVEGPQTSGLSRIFSAISGFFRSRK